MTYYILNLFATISSEIRRITSILLQEKMFGNLANPICFARIVTYTIYNWKTINHPKKNVCRCLSFCGR